jgi:signal transduction histidine kinase
MGIPVLRERAERLSALGYASTITIDAAPNKGTRVEIRADVSTALKA